MKHVLLSLLAAAILSACSQPSAEEQLIANYEQTIGDSKVDLNLKIQSIEKVGEITAADSIKYYSDILGSEELDEETLEKGREFIRLYENEWGERVQNTMRKRYDVIKAAVYATEGKAQYVGNPEEVLALKYKATYTINNPLLNGAEQELTREYLITPDKSKVLAKMKAEKE